MVGRLAEREVWVLLMDSRVPVTPCPTRGAADAPRPVSAPLDACMVAALSASPLLTLGQRAVPAHGGTSTVGGAGPEADSADLYERPSNQTFRCKELPALPAD